MKNLEVIVAVICLTLIELGMILKGINGTIAIVIVAAIAGLIANQVPAIPWDKLLSWKNQKK